MSNVFSFVGKLSLPKQSEKFAPIERRNYESSGWTNTTVKFNVISDTNKVMCMSQGGKWQNDQKNAIKTYSRTVTDANGKVIKGEPITIPWAKRFDADQVDKVAAYRRFIVDTGDVDLKFALRGIMADHKNGTDCTNRLAQVGAGSIEEAEDMLAKLEAKRKIFLSEWDFAEHLAKVLQSGKFNDALFTISGNYEVQYNANTQKFYTNYHVNRVETAKAGTEPTTELRIDFLFGENALDDSMVAETGKAYLSGWVEYYDSMVKGRGYYPMTVVVRDKVDALKRKFVCDDDEIKQIGLTLNVIDGAERQPITLEMLDDETREDIEMGFLDFEEVKRSMNNNVMGDRVSELRFAKLTPKKNIAQDTAYHRDDMHPAMLKPVEVDIFSDDFDDDL